MAFSGKNEKERTRVEWRCVTRTLRGPHLVMGGETCFLLIFPIQLIPFLIDFHQEEDAQQNYDYRGQSNQRNLAFVCHLYLLFFYDYI